MDWFLCTLNSKADIRPKSILWIVTKLFYAKEPLSSTHKDVLMLKWSIEMARQFFASILCMDALRHN